MQNNPLELQAPLAVLKGVTLWFTGLSGAGKTTLAHALERELKQQGRPCTVLDGDVLRQSINRDLGFSDADRHEAVRRTATLARSLNAQGEVALVSMISPLRSMRDNARSIIAPHTFLEVYVSTPLHVCEQRDVKGLYKKARSGELKEFTGVSAPYEVPLEPECIVDTQAEAVARAIDRLGALIRS